MCIRDRRMGISWQDLMDLGRINPGDAGERFCTHKVNLWIFDEYII